LETELKFEIDPATADQLFETLDLGAKGEELILKSVYYDTAEADLRRQGIALRVRDDGLRRIQTVKQASQGSISRGEWERQIEGPRPDIAATRDSPLARALGGKDVDALQPAFEVTVERARRDVTMSAGVVEVALDRGAVSADGYGAPICELELELKSGEVSALFDLARSLSEQAAMELSFISKAERGYALMEGAALSPAKARRPILDREDTAERAFRTIAGSALAQITANARVLRSARRPEAVHQLRVGARRLRIAIGLFGPMLADERRAAIKTELKWVAGELDEARDIDVLINETFRPFAERRRGVAGLSALGATLLSAQTRAYDRVEAALRSRRFSQLTLEAAAWIETGDWTRLTAPEQIERRQRPVRALAAEILTGLHRKVIRRGRDLERLDDEQRHRLRIRAKTLRYAGDFFASLQGGKSARGLARLTKALAAFQDGLGDLNDIAVGAGLIARLVGAEPAEDRAAPRRKSDPGRAFAAGLVWAEREARLGDAMGAALKAYRRLAKAKPYW
jgi:inorganic triphosphatase YgiF